MKEIKVSEVSDLLRNELQEMSASVQLDETGVVLQVRDGVVRIYGLRNAKSGELLEFDNGAVAIAMNLEEDNVGAVLFSSSEMVKENDTVKCTGKIASIMAGEGLIGRVIDTLGNPLDGKGPIHDANTEMPFERKAPGVIFRQKVKEPLQTGIKAIDAMTYRHTYGCRLSVHQLQGLCWSRHSSG